MAELLDSTYVEALYTGSDWGAVSTRAQLWLTTALARAKTVAPCLLTPDALPDHIAEAARGIIAGAVLRLLEPNSGYTQYQAAGPFSVSSDTKQRSDRVLSTADRDELRQLCRAVTKRRSGGTVRTPVGY